MIKGERSSKTICSDLFLLKFNGTLCCRKKKERRSQSKKDVEIYPMKQRHHTSPDRDSESHDKLHRCD